MKRRAIWAFALTAFFWVDLQAEVRSLSQVFQVKGGLLDTDGDFLAETIALSIVIPDEPRPAEIALAADLAARANFESLALDLDLVKREIELGERKPDQTLILISTRLRLLEKLRVTGQNPLPPLGPRQGAILLLGHSRGSHIAVIGGSDEALLKAGRAFFLRWPYLWEIWGREDGLTYQTVESDLARFWEEEGIIPPMTAIRSVLYEFPDLASSHETLRRLEFDSGEIADLRLECTFSDRKNKEKAARVLQGLRDAQRRGEMSWRLNYPGCR